MLKKLDTGLLRNEIWICTSSKDWEKLRKVHKFPKEWVYNSNTELATCKSHYTDSGYMVNVLCINPKTLKEYKCTLAESVNVIAHECYHCVYRTLEWMGESQYATEFPAYMQGWLSEEVLKVILPKLARIKI